jgi:hypothetical protein
VARDCGFEDVRSAENVSTIVPDGLALTDE